LIVAIIRFRPVPHIAFSPRLDRNANDFWVEKLRISAVAAGHSQQADITIRIVGVGKADDRPMMSR
jgi:hypothetical protein